MQIQKLLEELKVSRETFLKLEEYVVLLKKWNKSINLVSANDVDNIWEKHILICAELIKYISDLDIKVIDLGSGSGLPGIVLSIMGVKQIVLIEANTKKASFLLQASKISDNFVEVINDRIENQQLNCDIIVARALASMEKLLDFTKYINFTDSMLLIKGLEPEKEMYSKEICPQKISFLNKFSFDISTSQYNKNSSIVIVKKIINE
jgi:16S rRNA (guanine527-N7)-methyltransferase